MKRQPILYITLIGLLFLISACGGPKLQGGVSIPVQDFTYTNQDNEPVSLEDLKGGIWMADFIFTNCADVCSPMTANMSKIQSKIQEEGLQDQVSFVSFSVDPEIDTPETLKTFAEKFNADHSNWHFLTGYTMEEISSFASNSFEALVNKPENSDQVIHGTRFYLVDETGTVVKTYQGLQLPLDEIVNDIKTLLKN